MKREGFDNSFQKQEEKEGHHNGPTLTKWHAKFRNGMGPSFFWTEIHLYPRHCPRSSETALNSSNIFVGRSDNPVYGPSQPNEFWLNIAEVHMKTKVQSLNSPSHTALRTPGHDSTSVRDARKKKSNWVKQLNCSSNSTDHFSRTLSIEGPIGFWNFNINIYDTWRCRCPILCNWVPFSGINSASYFGLGWPKNLWEWRIYLLHLSPEK